VARGGSENLRQNVFSNELEAQSCELKYSVDGGAELTEIWAAASGVEIGSLNSLDVFDSDVAELYVSKDREATYTPPVLLWFEYLAQLCSKLKVRLQNERNLVQSSFPQVPDNIGTTASAADYRRISSADSKESIEKKFSFTELSNEALASLETKLKTSDHAALIHQRKAQIQYIELIVDSYSRVAEQLSLASCRQFNAVRKKAISARLVASESAAAVFAGVQLDGVSSETWRALWESARQYSQVAYPGEVFPNVQTGALCIFCHQVLSPDAGARLVQFESFVAGALEKEAFEAELTFESARNLLPVIMSDEKRRLDLQAAGLLEGDWLPNINNFWIEVERVKSALLSGNEADDCCGAEYCVFLSELTKKADELKTSVVQLEVDSTLLERASAERERLELLGLQWFSKQFPAILAEVERLKQLDQFDEWIKKADSTAVSKKAGVVAESILTESYLQRFNTELTKLGAGHIKVEIAKSGTRDGKTKHALKLKGVSKPNSKLDILSEGEKRIVGLAAFLADVTGHGSVAPFIFDDPISSLDQDYEEATADRLVELSKERQVIVFTHRLSFFGLLHDRCSDEMFTSIRNEFWGAGEPTVTPLFAKKPINALKDLNNSRLTKAKKVLEEQGFDEYYPLGKAVCSDLRILVERFVEFYLLADVIARHRRDLNTKGKLESLPKIQAQDCQLFTDLMTSYSRFEHSQPLESPNAVPKPDAIQKDIEKMTAWHGEFTSRALVK
jgi:energy-coupling factor transporter ATP-binding protein EcfA2